MSIAGMIQAESGYSRILADGRVQCDLCPRECQLKDGQRGLCYVRGCENGEVRLLNYGRASGFCIDPVEKKPLNHFLPGTPVLSFGTAGCNLSCKFCQNWDISKSRKQDQLAAVATPERIAQAAARQGCRSVAYTYNDPVIFLEYAVDTAWACRDNALKNVAVTAGYVSGKAREDFFAPMDAANVDLKAFTNHFYKKLCGGRLEPVLETLQYLKYETSIWLELTTLLIPGHNDSQAELNAMTQWVVENLGPEVPMHFSAFHPDWKMRDVPPTPPSTLTLARDIAKANGVYHAYTGNVHDAKGSSTYCHHCGHLLIERDWFELGAWQLDQAGKCGHCDTPLAGVFEAQAGIWGSRRLAVAV